MRPPRTPSGKPPSGRPVSGKSPGGKSPAGRTSTGKPSTGKPAFGKPAFGNDNPRADRPRADRPRTDKPHTDRPRADRPRADRPRADRPQTDRLRPDGPRAERPHAERPRADGPRAPKAPGDRIGTGRPAFGKAPAGRPATGKTIPAPKLGRRQARTLTSSAAANPHPARAAAAAKGSKEPQRIAKLLARAGVASRREIERMIVEGRVALDGVAVETPATLLTSLKGVTVDEKPVAPPEATRLFLFHKPKGVLTTEHDPKGRTTIYDRLPQDLPRVMPVGRLDYNTEGLLLLTTDGEFKRQLELPATGIERIYRARAHGNVTQEQLESLIEGIEIEGVRYGSIDANMERRTGANVWIEMKLREGKNREVRRVLEHLGLEVSRLIRVAYGAFELGDLQPGETGEILQHQLVAFRKTLKDGK
jgi:23S rRNA pseudouridine2605 synthase